MKTPRITVLRHVWSIAISASVGLSAFTGTCLASGEELLDAAEKGNLTSVSLLLDGGEDVNFSPAPIDSPDVSSPLTVAIANSHGEVVHELLRRKANLDQIGAAGGTPLMHAALRGNFPLVELLLKLGANPNIRYPEAYTGDTALHWAVAGGSPEVVSLLLEHKADPSLLNSQNHSPMMNAIERGKLALARLLLKRGSNPDQEVFSSFFRKSGTILSLAMDLLRQRKRQHQESIGLQRLVVLMRYPEYIELEVPLEMVLKEKNYDPQTAEAVVDSILNHTASECTGEKLPRIKGLQYLCLEVILKKNSKN